MSDARIRTLARDAAAGGSEAALAHAVAWLRAGGRDPRRHPRPGDVVSGRKVLACSRDMPKGPPGWKVENPAWFCALNLGWMGRECPYIHWVRVSGRGYRANQCMMTRWRAWAINSWGGTVVQAIGAG